MLFGQSFVGLGGTVDCWADDADAGHWRMMYVSRIEVDVVESRGGRERTAW